MTNTKNAKVFAVGLDGVPYTLLMDYIAKGYLPGIKRILDDGYGLHQMDASVPDVSSTSWSSFMTGVNPAEHGIYGFIDLEPGSYNMFFPNSTDISAPTIWEIAEGSAGGKTSTLSERYQGRLKGKLKSLVFNIPQTYPARKLNGVLTAGFVCPDLRKGTYPEGAYDYLKGIGYFSDIDATKAVDRKDDFFKEILLSLEKRQTAYEHFLRNEPWDIFIGVITETDRLHHFFYDAAYDENHPYHHNFVEFYGKIDSFVARLYDIFRSSSSNGLFLTMSDHGFTTLKSEVYINIWLKEQGLLNLDGSREYFDQIDTGTRVFAMDPARFYVNLENKYPRGSVREAGAGGVLDDLVESLNGLVDVSGNKVIRKIYRNGDIYKGPLTRKGPDLVCLANDGFDLKGNMKRAVVFGKGPFTGMHTSYDAHCILPEGMAGAARLHIEKLAGFMLDHLSSSKENN